jgi:hypothetical protein
MGISRNCNVPEPQLNEIWFLLEQALPLKLNGLAAKIELIQGDAHGVAKCRKVIVFAQKDEF